MMNTRESNRVQGGSLPTFESGICHDNPVTGNTKEGGV